LDGAALDGALTVGAELVDTLIAILSLCEVSPLLWRPVWFETKKDARGDK
jgi:hypothetical protein